MTVHDATEQAYKNGYEAGKRDAEKQGRWVDRYGGKYANPLYECSECKGEAQYKCDYDVLCTGIWLQNLTDYCPGCGAKMDARRTDNGVTVQEWVPVTERLPTIHDADADNCVLAIHKASDKRYYHWRTVADNPFDFTFWTKVPEPPKED